MTRLAPGVVFVACLVGAAACTTPDYAWVYVLAVLLASSAAKRTTHEGMSVAAPPPPPPRSLAAAIQLPRTNRLVAFAHSDTVGKITNAVETGGGFSVKVDREQFSTVVGPPSDRVLRKNDVAIFITIGDNAQTSGAVSLFLAKCNAILEDGGEERRVELALRDRKNGNGRTLVGTYGTDTLEVAFDDTLTPRTYYLVRANGKLLVGVSEPLTSTAHENETDTTAAVVNQSTQPCQLNSTGAKIGTILSVALYEGDVSAVKGDVLRALARHALGGNELYSELRGQLDRQRELSAAMRRPRFSGPAVAHVDWSSFDPAAATSECRASIKASCEADATQRGCECWDETNDAYATRACKMIRELYAPEPEKRAPPPPPPPRTLPALPATHAARPPSLLRWLFPSV
jgi:hypothetical protein